MSPPFFHQASIWIELVKKFEFKSINLIHSFDNEGKMLTSRFNYLADQHDINVTFALNNIYDFRTLLSKSIPLEDFNRDGIRAEQRKLLRANPTSFQINISSLSSAIKVRFQFFSKGLIA